MSMSRNFGLVAVAALLTTATAARADWNWAWSLAGPGLSANGQLTTAGDASSFEEITAFGGTFNGQAITGILPLNSDPLYFYDNLFEYSAGAGRLSPPGILFGLVDSSHVNFGDGPPIYGIRSLGGGYIQFFTSDDFLFAATPLGMTPAVPEPATVVLLLAGLAGLGLWKKREKGAID